LANVTRYDAFGLLLVVTLKSLVYEMKLQIVAEVTGHIFDAAAEIRNDSTNKLTFSCLFTSVTSNASIPFNI